MEEVLYDTSALIEKYKEGCRTLEDYTTILNVIEFPKALEIKNLKVIYPNVDDYKTALVLSKDLLKKGSPIPAVDIVIAAVALNRNLVLETLDNHFKVIKSIRKEFKLKVLR